MPMNPNFLCCIGAELKNSTQQTTRMCQVYLYRAFEDDTLSDMLSAGFFNAAMGIIRQDDLLLLYSPNETTAKYTYARVSSVSSSGVVIERVGIEATSISVDTTGYSNLSGNNLQEILNNLDTTITTINNAFVKKDGSSIMTGPLKIRAGSMQGAIAAYWDGVGFFKLNSDDSVTLLASMEATDGLCPATNNTYNIGKTNYKWKDAYIARVITAVLNNGYDIAVPVTNGPDTLALKSEVDTAANSGRMITDTGVWFAKMYAASTVPTGAEYEGTNYADFSQVDSDNNPIIVIYEYQSGSWVETERVTPPANYDGYVPVTKKMWDIIEQTGQQGGRVLWNHQSKEFTPYPNIVDLSNVATTDLDNLTPTGEAKFTAKANTDMDNLTSTGQNIANWSSNVSNCITEIPQDIKLELSSGTLTLKAGSKVYVPNGADTFDVITVASDISATPTSAGTGTLLLFLTADGTALQWRAVGSCGSGTTETGTGTTYYNTSTNIITAHNSGGNVQVSFPIGAIYSSSNVITSIDQIFNGFGYIGSTVFALPGVKGLIPNYRNADGSLKSTEFTTSSVVARTFSNTENRSRAEILFDGSYFSRLGNGEYYYNENENMNYGSSGVLSYVFLGSITLNSGVVSNFNIARQSFHAVDYSDTEYIAHQAMPSDRYIDLTLPASGQSITLPADGYIVFVKQTTGNQFIALRNNLDSTLTNWKGYSFSYGQNSLALGCMLPVKKGDLVSVHYSAAGTTNCFRFVYANGVL